jgi:hypothetical protein
MLVSRHWQGILRGVGRRTTIPIALADAHTSAHNVTDVNIHEDDTHSSKIHTVVFCDNTKAKSKAHPWPYQTDADTAER